MNQVVCSEPCHIFRCDRWLGPNVVFGKLSAQVAEDHVELG